MDVSFCEYVSFLKENVSLADTKHAYNYLQMSLSCTVFDGRYGTDILSLPKPVTTTYGLKELCHEIQPN